MSTSEGFRFTNPRLRALVDKAQEPGITQEEKDQRMSDALRALFSLEDIEKYGTDIPTNTQREAGGEIVDDGL